MRKTLKAALFCLDKTVSAGFSQTRDGTFKRAFEKKSQKSY